MARTKKSTSASRVEGFDAFAQKQGGLGFHKFPNVEVNLADAVGGVGCVVSLTPTCHLYMMSTNSEKLAVALKELGIKKSERSDIDVGLISHYPVDLFGGLSNREENDSKVWWVSDSKEERFEMFYGFALRYRSDLKIVGEAVKFTRLECKLLLRGKKWDRKYIEAAIIDDEHPDDKIPF